MLMKALFGQDACEAGSRLLEFQQVWVVQAQCTGYIKSVGPDLGDPVCTCSWDHLKASSAPVTWHFWRSLRQKHFFGDISISINLLMEQDNRSPVLVNDNQVINYTVFAASPLCPYDL